MTAQTPDVYSGNLPTDDTDEIDLRRYLLVLARWWREILIISLFAGVIAGTIIFFVNNSRTPMYAATSDLIIARLVSNIELDERISTTNAAAQSDAGGWRTSLLQLVQNSVVANEVIEELGDKLPPELRNIDAILGVISAEIPISEDGKNFSNLIRITAITDNPEISAQIATSWAGHLVFYINGLYGEVPQTMLESVSLEREQSLLRYQAAEKAYEEFVANNKIDELSRQLDEKSTLRSELMVNFTRMVTAVVSTDYNARLDLYHVLANANTEHAKAVVTAQLDGNVELLNQLYGLRGSAIAQLNQARNMERSLVDGGGAAAKSNISALQLLKLTVFASVQATDSVPANLSISSIEQPIDMNLDEQLADVRALITVLEEYLNSLDADITALAEAKVTIPALSTLTESQAALDAQDEQIEIAAATTDTDTASAYAHLLMLNDTFEQLPPEIQATLDDTHETVVTKLESEIRTLRAAMTAEEARQQQLIHQRDLAWTTYEAVGNKLQELNLLRSSANSEVRMGNPAVVPREPRSEWSPVLLVVALTVAGFFIAILVALLVDSVGGGPFFARRPT